MHLKILHRYILKSFIGPLVLAFCIVIFILLMQWLWLWIDELAGKGLEFGVIAHLLLYTSASLVPMALPISVLFSSIMAIGNLGEAYELTAMKSAGISLRKILAPLFTACAIITLMAFLFSNYMLPYCNLKMKSLLYDIRQKRPEMQIEEGVFYAGLDNYRIRIGSKNYETNMLYNMQIYDHSTNRGNTAVTVADSGLMYMTANKQFLVIDLFHGYNYEEVEEQNRILRSRKFPFRQNAFNKQTIQIDISEFQLSRTDESLFKQNNQMMNLGQLTQGVDSLQQISDGKIKELYAYSKSYTIQSDRFKSKRDTINNSMETSDDVMVAINELPIKERVELIGNAKMYARSLLETTSTYSSEVDSLSEKQRRFMLEWWKKFSLSFSCIVFFFIGAPLGALIRKGGMGVPLVVSVLFFVLYYVISSTGEKFAREGVLPPFAGSWLSTLIILPIGIILFYHAVNDSSALNSESYQILVSKITDFFKNLKRSKARQ